MGFLKHLWMRIEKAYSTSENEPAPPGVSPPDTGKAARKSEAPKPEKDDHEYWRSDTR